MRKIILSIKGFGPLNSLKEKRIFWKKFINLQKNLPSNIDLKFIIKNSNEQQIKFFTFLFNPSLKLNFNEDYQLKKDYYYTFDFKVYKKYFSINRNIINKLIYSLK